MHDNGPYSNYRLTVRLSLENKPGVFATVVDLLAKEKASLGAIDIVEVTKEKMLRDVTFDTMGEAHGKKVIDQLNKLEKVRKMKKMLNKSAKHSKVPSS